MRFRTRSLSQAALAALLAAVVAGCGASGLNGSGAAQRTGAAQAANGAQADPDGPDIALDRWPDEQVVVPAHPTRVPQPATEHNSATLYVSPAETLPAVKALIADAKQSVYLETFNFGNDSYGRQLVPLLIAKAKAGLEVKVVMDYIGSRFLKNHKALVRELREGGVDVRVYRARTIVKSDRRVGVNITHRKVYLADGMRALVGGVNLVAPFDTTTQDALIDWRGPVVAQLYNEYAIDWRAAKGGALNQAPVETGNQGDVEAQLVVTSPIEGRNEARDVCYRMIEGASRSIEIEQQYLMDDGLIARLHGAAKRGVKIRVMVPGKEHGGMFRNIHAGELHKLTLEGAEAHVYHGTPDTAHLHAKYMCVDDNWALLGSTNFDTRALLENQELSIATTDRTLVGKLKQRLFERDWGQHSDPFVYEEGSWVLKRWRTVLELLDYYL